MESTISLWHNVSQDHDLIFERKEAAKPLEPAVEEAKLEEECRKQSLSFRVWA